MALSGGAAWLLHPTRGAVARGPARADRDAGAHARAGAERLVPCRARPRSRRAAGATTPPWPTSSACSTQGRGRLDTTTVRVIERNLATIDSAIAQAQRAVAADSANAYLNSHLAETMRRKLELLRQAAALVSSVS